MPQAFLMAALIRAKPVNFAFAPSHLLAQFFGNAAALCDLFEPVLLSRVQRLLFFFSRP